MKSFKQIISAFLVVFFITNSLSNVVFAITEDTNDVVYNDSLIVEHNTEQSAIDFEETIILEEETTVIEEDVVLKEEKTEEFVEDVSTETDDVLEDVEKDISIEEEIIDEEIELFCGSGYSAGHYKIPYDIDWGNEGAPVRLGPAKSYTQVHTTTESSYVYLSNIKTSSSGHYWGQTINGYWICICTGDLKKASPSLKNTGTYVTNKRTKKRNVPRDNDSAGYTWVESGQAISITQVRYNEWGNQWGKTSDGKWIYMGNLNEHKSHNYNTPSSYTKGYQNKNEKQHIKVIATNKKYCTVCGYVKDAYYESKVNENHSFHLGRCTICGYNFVLSRTSMGNKRYEIKDNGDSGNGIPVRTLPYKEQPSSFTAYKGQVYKIANKATNAAQHTWYETTDGYWIYSDNMKEHKHSYEDGICSNSSCKDVKPIEEKTMGLTLLEVKEDGKKIRNRPYEVGDHVDTVNKGQVLKSTVYYKNDYGKKWYKVNGGWIYSGNVDEHKNHNYYNGVCSNKGCGDVFNLKEKIYDKPKKQELIFGGKIARVIPYSTASGTRTLELGEVVTIVGEAKNAKKNLWYKTSDGDWIFEDNLDDHKHKYVYGVCENKGCNAVYNLKVKTYSNTKAMYTTHPSVPARQAPYENATAKATIVSQDSKVIIDAEVKNSYGNLWYRTTDGLWIYEDNISPHVHEYENGKCKKLFCGYEWPYSVVKMNATTFVVKKDDVPVWKRPYKDSGQKDTKDKNDKVTVIGKTTNQHGHLWYKLNGGNWIYSDNVEEFTNVRTPDSDNSGIIKKDSYKLTVKDAATKAIIHNAVVQLGDTHYSADASGMIYLPYSTKSTYLEVNAEGYKTISMEFVMSPLKSQTIFMSTGESYEIIRAELVYSDSVTDILGTTKTVNQANNNLKFSIVCKSNGSDVTEYRLMQNGKTIATSSNGTFGNLTADSFEKNVSVYVAAYVSGVEKAQKKLQLNVIYQKSNVPTTLSIGKDLKLTLPSSIPLVGGNKISVRVPTLPVTVKMNEDYIQIAVNHKSLSQNSENKSAWDGLKNMCKGNVKTYMKNNSIYKPNENGVITGAKAGFDFSTKFIGYGEGSLSSKYLKVTLYVEIGCEYMNEWQFFIAAIPCVFELSAELKGDGSAEFKWAKDAGFDTDFVLDAGIEGAISPYVGLGVAGLASAGVYGTINSRAAFNIVPRTRFDYWYLTGKVGAKIKALGYTVADAEIYNFSKFYIINNGDPDLMSLEDMPYVYVSLTDSDNYDTLVSRDYLNNRSEWYPENQIDLFEEGGESETTDSLSNYDFDILQSSTYTDIKPQVVSNGETIMMLYCDDHADRAINDRTMLVYSIYNPASREWSKPLPVCEDGTADYNFKASSDGEGIYVVWQNATRNFEDDETISTVAPNTELYVAVYDDTVGAFNNIDRVTSSDSYEACPTITHINDEIIVSWFTNDENDIFGIDGKNTMHYATIKDSEFIHNEEAEGEPETDEGYVEVGEEGEVFMPGEEIEEYPEEDVIVENVFVTKWNIVNLPQEYNMITSIDTGALFEGNYIAFTVDEDEDLQTTEDQYIKVICMEDESVIDLTDGALNAAFTQVHGDNALTWFNSGHIYYVLDPYDAPQMIFDNTAIPNNEYHIITEENGDMALLYTVKENNSSNAYTILYDDETFTWGLPIKVTNQDKYIQNFNGAYSNGMIVTVFNQTTVDEEYHEDNNLCSAIIGDRYDIAISKVEFDDIQIAPDKESTATVTIKNNGTMFTEYVSVEVYNDVEEVVYQENIKVDLTPGYEIEIPVTLPAMETIEKTTYKVQIYNSDLNDDQPTDNYSEFTIGRAAFKTDAVYYEADGEIAVSVIVENMGYESGSGSIVLYDEDGNIYKTVLENFETISFGERIETSFMVSKEYFEGMPYKDMHIGIVTDTEQYTDTYNDTYLHIKNPYTSVNVDVGVSSNIDDGIELMEDSENTRTISGVIANSTETEVPNAQICIIAYDRRGVFIEVKTIDVSVGAKEAIDFDATFIDDGNISMFKVMLINKETFEILTDSIDIVINNEDTSKMDQWLENPIAPEEVEY